MRLPEACKAVYAGSIPTPASKYINKLAAPYGCAESAPTSALSTDCFFAHHHVLALEAQCDVGGGPSGVPPGPELNVSHGAVGGCCPTRIFEKSQTPDGNACWIRALTRRTSFGIK